MSHKNSRTIVYIVVKVEETKDLGITIGGIDEHVETTFSVTTVIDCNNDNTTSDPSGECSFYTGKFL